MQLQTLKVTKEQAAMEVVNYRRALKLRRNAEDEAILRGYNAVLKGKKLVRLSDAIKAGGLDHRHLPRLAVMRADMVGRTVEVTVFSDGSANFFVPWRPRPAKSASRAFPRDTFPRIGEMARAASIVPGIPPQFRPDPDKAYQYWILWEETNWNKQMSADPALLKQLKGDLYVVVAMWDLTDLERSVLGSTVR